MPRPESVPSMTLLLYCPWMKSLLSDPTLFTPYALSFACYRSDLVLFDTHSRGS